MPTTPSQCPELLLQWAGAIFDNPHLQAALPATRAPLDGLDCATDIADYHQVGGHGFAEIALSRPDPAKVPEDIPLPDWVKQDATAMLRVQCGDGTPTATTVGAVTELSCTHATTPSRFTAAFSVSNDRAAAAAILNYTGGATPDTATRDYLTAQARTLAYAMLGGL